MKSLLIPSLPGSTIKRCLWNVALFAFVSVFSPELHAQSTSSRFWAEGAVHDESFTVGYDAIQACANAFIYEGKHDEYFKFERRAWHKKRKKYKSLSARISEDEDDRKDIIREKIEQYMQKKGQLQNPYPLHGYVVMIRPSFKPTVGFAVDKDKIVFMSYFLKDPKKPDSKIEIRPTTTEVSQDFCQAFRSLMDNITNSARVSNRGANTLDGTTYSIITGFLPTHMVSTKDSGDPTKKAVLELVQKICDAARNNDASAVNAQLQETKRLEAIYKELCEKAK